MASLGTLYPLKHYVTYTKFSSSHQHFLAAITKVQNQDFIMKLFKMKIGDTPLRKK